MPERAERAARTDDRAHDAVAPATAPVAGSRSVLLSLQRSAGNRAVAQVLARRPEDVDPAPAASTQELIAKAFSSKDPADVKAIGGRNFGQATEDQRWDFIHTLAYQGWVGPRDEWALEDLWNLWGDGVLKAAAKHPDWWAKSIDGGAELLKLDAVKATPPKFIEDVRAVATGHLEKNDELARNELADLGETVEGVTAAPRDPNARLAGIQEGAKMIRAAQAAQAELSGYAVGWLQAHDEDSAPELPEEQQRIAPPAPFAHGHPPFFAYKAPRLTYAEVEAQWQVLQKIIEGQQAKYPALYAVAHQGASDDMQKVADGAPGSRELILQTLRDLRGHIKDTRPKLAGDLVYELAPVQGQLFAGTAKGPSQIDWSNPVYKPLGQETLEGHKEHDFWVTLGLGSLAAGMFLIATLGTGAPLLASAAAGAGAGVSAGMAAVSWEKAYTVAQAQKTGASKDTEIVADGAAEGAVVEALLNTVFAAMDGWAAFKLAGEAAQTGARALVTTAEEAGKARAVVLNLAQVKGMGLREARDAIERSVVSSGVEKTVAETGLDASALLAKVGETSLVSARLRSYIALPEELVKLSPEEVARRLADLDREFARNREVGQSLVRVGVEKLGPLETLRKAGGWAKLRPKGSEVIQPIIAWEQAALLDLDRALERLPESIRGPEMERKFAEDFLAGRMGGSVEELGIGTAKPITPGVGEKAITDALANGADRRATAHLGLANPDAMRAMADSGAALRVRWPNLTMTERMAAFRTMANERLRAAGIPEFIRTEFVKEGKGHGAFNRAAWTLELDLNMLMTDLMPDEMVELVYHETRHAEQAFQAARLRASSMSVEDMVKPVAEGGLGMEETAAKLAKASPLAADSAEGRLAQQWADSLWGAAGSQPLRRARIYGEMDTAREAWLLAVDSKRGLAGAELAAQERRIDQAWENYLEKLTIYKQQLPEEADAYAIQAKFREAEAQHLIELDSRMPDTR